ncbi:hypothetical protein ACSMXM_05670 [Pacificimonas sp. ICDLI1SI03]
MTKFSNLMFEPHNGYGKTGFDGEPNPFGYISTSTPQPVFELMPPLVFPAKDLEALAYKMAAAPDLYEAVEALLVSHRAGTGQCCAAADKGIAALAKARGETA